MAVEIDAIGNILGTWGAGDNSAPIMVGSHIDTVVDAGIYDGSYGVLAGLEVVETLRDAGFTAARPITVAAFTNEEGVRYTPDMMGSLVYAGGFPLEAATRCVGTDGTIVGEELARIGYAGPMAPGAKRPAAYLELHVEQGPVLEHEGMQIGAVENLQGISWQRIVIRGQANHAGTTPMRLRHDAGYAAARITTFMHDLATGSGGTTVATVGTVALTPNVINVIPARATLTVDLRDADERRLSAADGALAGFLVRLADELRVTIEAERLVRFQPVTFDAELVALITEVATRQGLRTRRMTSGAGHDAQMMARIAPAAMIFVPSEQGISHSPAEHTSDQDVVAGANVLLGVVKRLASQPVDA
jgi:beta-ureidopropionase / N-carbamoyl-L-amino-acid hydrolase